MGRSACSQPNNSRTLSSPLQGGAAKDSQGAMQTNTEVRRNCCGHFEFVRKLLAAINASSFPVCAAWTFGSLVIVSLIFVFTFFIKPPGGGVVTHGFISTNPVTTNGQPIGGEQKWLEDFSHSVEPRACHSHNDYLRPYPLFSALAAGCSSVEADVWLTEDGTDLLVGHEEASLTPDRRLTNMYLDPLLSMLDSINVGSDNIGGEGANTPPNGVFRMKTDATLVLLIDVKSQSDRTWRLVVEQLSALRDKRYLTRYEEGRLTHGPITIVGSGNIGSDPDAFTSTHVDLARQFEVYHDGFLDAPLASLPQADRTVGNGKDLSTLQDSPERLWTNKTAYYASTSFKATIGSVVTGFSPSQLPTLRAQIAAAARLGLKSRYWDTPDWPVGYRNYVWGVLEREGVGVLNVDDLEGAARGGWDADGQAWARDAAWMISIGAWALCCGVAVVLLGWKRRRAGATKDSE